MTTPNEFLEFAKQLGLERKKPTTASSLSLSSSSSSSAAARLMSNNNPYAATGLSVLNSLCHLLEQIHQLKSENSHLRAHLELVDNVEKFRQRLLFKDTHENTEPFIPSSFVYNDEKASASSPSYSIKLKHTSSNQEREGTVCVFLIFYHTMLVF